MSAKHIRWYDKELQKDVNKPSSAMELKNPSKTKFLQKQQGWRREKGMTSRGKHREKVLSNVVWKAHQCSVSWNKIKLKSYLMSAAIKFYEWNWYEKCIKFSGKNILIFIAYFVCTYIHIETHTIQPLFEVRSSIAAPLMAAACITSQAERHTIDPTDIYVNWFFLFEFHSFALISNPNYIHSLWFRIIIIIINKKTKILGRTGWSQPNHSLCECALDSV